MQSLKAKLLYHVIVSVPPEDSYETDYSSLIPVKKDNVCLKCTHLLALFWMSLQCAFNWIGLKSSIHFQRPGARGYNLLQLANLITQFISPNNVRAIHRRAESRSASYRFTCNSFSRSQLGVPFIVFVWKLPQSNSIIRYIHIMVHRPPYY